MRGRSGFETGFQRRVLDGGRQFRKQRANFLVLVRAQVGAPLIFVCHQRQHHADKANLALREGLADQGRNCRAQTLDGEVQDLVAFGVHAPTIEPRRSASTLLWKARQYQPEKALIGSTLRPSEYSRAAEIQIAAPLRLAKISHHRSALGSAFKSLAVSQAESALPRSLIPPAG